jgi:hypothetical protein
MWVVVVISTRAPRATSSAASRNIAVVLPPLPVNATTSQPAPPDGGPKAAIPSASANVGTQSATTVFGVGIGGRFLLVHIESLGHNSSESNWCPMFARFWLTWGSFFGW